jgi:hypothetical protein
MSSQLDTLAQINLNDLVSSFGWEQQPFLASLVRRFFICPAQQFAQQMVDFDNNVGKLGLAEASRQILRQRYVYDVRVHGREHVPATGPALFLSNHPGMTDTISLFLAIGRLDLNIIALHRSFLAALTNTANNLFFIDDEPAKRLHAIRQISSHLRAGHAGLTFPAGSIEPDPDVYPGAIASLNNWVDSAGTFVRFAKDAQIVPVLVSSVIWQKAAHHLLTRLKRTRVGREKLAAALQLLAMVTRDARPTTTHVRFAKPISLDEVGSTDSQAIHTKVIERMQGLIQNMPTDEGVSVL